jgi:D-alanyl-D-alanine carboxypeptidase
MYPTARRLLVALTLALATIFAVDFGPVSLAQAQSPYDIAASRYAAIVEDASSGEVLYEKNADATRYPASISKIMTLYLTFEALEAGRLKLTDPIYVSQHAANMAPSKLGLRPGESVTVDEAIRAVTVKSCNDIAVALAEKIGGSESQFAALMTLRAQELGMSNTHYVNASGLPDMRQVSSARDIATLSRAIMRDYPQYYHYFGVQSLDWGGRTIRNHNGLLGRAPGVDGLKTGYINASGFNLAASAQRDGRRLIVVVMGGSSAAARDAHVADLLDTGFTVMRMRALGQNVNFAQNLSEPSPIGPVVRPPTEEGSGDQAGVQIVLTGQPAAAHAITPDTPSVSEAPRAEIGQYASTPRATRGERRREAARARTSDQWGVQIGAYRRKGQARDQLATLERRYSRLGDADRNVQAAGHGYYRARFSGLSAAEARRACLQLRHHHQTCELVSPDR